MSTYFRFRWVTLQLDSLFDPRKRYVVEGDVREEFSQLLIFGAKPSVVDQWKITPLHLAGWNRNPEIVGLLVKACRETGALSEYINLKNDDSHTPLMDAIVGADFQAVKTLLDYGAGIHTVDKDGSNALNYAASRNYRFILELLLQRASQSDQSLSPLLAQQNGFSMNPLLDAALKGFPEIMQLLLENGFDWAVQGMKNKRTVLSYAAEQNHIEALRVALKYAKRSNDRAKLIAWINARDTKGRTALQYALGNNNFRIAEEQMSYRNK